MMIDTVIGIEMNCINMGIDSAVFTYQKISGGFEVLMNFRGIRRFALCTHENDAEHICDSLNRKNAI